MKNMKNMSNIEDMIQTYSKFSEYENDVYEKDYPRIKKVLKTILSLEKGKILEIGCLSGKIISILKTNGWKAYGIDIIDKPDVFDKDIMFIKHNVENGIPFDDNFFDVVYAGEVIEHLYDTDEFIKEVNRILKNNGYFIVTTPNISSFINRCLLLAGKLPRYVEYKKGGAGHIHFYTMKILEDQLYDNGFNIEKKIGNFFSFPDITKGKKIRKSILSFLGDYFPTFSENLIIVAKVEK